MVSKCIKLKSIQKIMEADTSLPLRTNLVFGEGSASARILFIGEAPGAEEDKITRPFVGRSGQLLRNTLRAANIFEKDFYITNIVKRRPPNNRDPSKKEVEAYAKYLSLQIITLNPRIIVPLGKFATQFFLPGAVISQDQGKQFVVGGQIIYPAFHPAAALRSRKINSSFKKSLKRLSIIISRESK